MLERVCGHLEQLSKDFIFTRRLLTHMITSPQNGQSMLNQMLVGQREGFKVGFSHQVCWSDLCPVDLIPKSALCCSISLSVSDALYEGELDSSGTLRLLSCSFVGILYAAFHFSSHWLDTHYMPGFQREALLSGRCRLEHTSLLIRCFWLVRHTGIHHFFPDRLFQIMVMDRSSFLLLLRWQTFHLDMKITILKVRLF